MDSPARPVYWLDTLPPATMRSVDDVITRLEQQAIDNAAGQDALEQLVLEAHAEKKSLRQIAAAARMTPEGVRKMLARLTKKED
jgi:hypothetical protein